MKSWNLQVICSSMQLYRFRSTTTCRCHTKLQYATKILTSSVYVPSRPDRSPDFKHWRHGNKNIQSRKEHILTGWIVYNSNPYPWTRLFILPGSWIVFYCAYCLCCHSLGILTAILSKAWIRLKSVKLETEVWHILRAIKVTHYAEQSICSSKPWKWSVHSKLVIVFQRGFSQRDRKVILPPLWQVIAAYPFYTGMREYWPLPSHTYWYMPNN